MRYLKVVSIKFIAKIFSLQTHNDKKISMDTIKFSEELINACELD